MFKVTFLRTVLPVLEDNCLLLGFNLRVEKQATRIITRLIMK